jgi:hypothetical protein
VAWTFRKQPKFFDIVTYTGNGTERTIGHNLGSTPGCIIVKELTVGSTNWCVYHRGLPTPQSRNIYLNATDASGASNFWNNTSPTSTVFSLGTSDQVNGNGQSYVAYLFAHDAGGFGLAGTDNVISCGSYTGTGAALSVSLGYEPQLVIIKPSSTTGDWQLVDNMRGWTADGVCQRLEPNTSDAESTSGATLLFPTATGFGSSAASSSVNGSGGTYIYIAIRRGPMAVPELGTTVFTPVTATPGGSAATVTTNITTDLIITAERSHALSGQTYAIDRLRGSSSSDARFLATQSTAAEAASAGGFTFSSPANIAVNDNLYPASGITNPVIYWFFSRAPGFFDEVCYTSNYSGNPAIPHNLGVPPELIINKCRATARTWLVLSPLIGSTNALYLDKTEPSASVGTANTFTATTFQQQATQWPDATTFVTYLFATCPGVSKVGSYTGTGTTLAINCGFTTGARFVLIKRTDSTGDWYVWDSARGIIAGNDPYILLNSTAAEVTGTDYIDPVASGFEISSTAPAAINASGGSFIFLAIS